MVGTARRSRPVGRGLRGFAASVVALAALVCLQLALAAGARAEIVHFEEPYSPINGVGDAVLQAPAGIAIDEATGNVFVAESANRNQVSILGGEGGAPDGLVSPFTVTEITIGNITRDTGQVAFDNNPASPGYGRLYVTDTRNPDVTKRSVKAFELNPVTQTYEPVGDFVPALVAAPALEAKGVAVATNGNVWVADFQQRAVIEFDPSGTELGRIDLVEAFRSPSGDGRPKSVAISAAGDVFVMEFWPDTSRVAKWVADSDGDIDPSEEAVFVQDTVGAYGMALDRSGNFLYIAFADRVVQYDVESLAKLGEFGTGKLIDARGVAVNETNGRVYVTDQGAKDVKVFGPSIRTAVVDLSDATDIATTTATLTGSVSAQGSQLSVCRFEYGTSDEYGESVPCPGVIPPNMSTQQLSVPLTNLEPNTTYHFRLVAENASGILSTTADATFTTKGKPRISGTVPIWVDRNTAKLGAYINPSGFSTHYRFEWGPTDDYGHTVPADFEPSIPGGTERVKVVANLSGLNQATTYHFRVVATNAYGTTFGPDQRFETLNSCGFILDRCLELVSSADKGFMGNAGDGIAGEGLFYQAATAGSSVVYPVAFGFTDATTGGEVIYRSERGDAGWAHEQLSPEITAPSPPEDGSNSLNRSNSLNHQSRVLGFSRDMSCFAFLSPHLLTPDAPRSTVEAGFVNLFLRDRNGETRVVSSRPIEGRPGTSFNSTLVVGISDDCGKVVFHTDYKYVGLSGAGEFRLYEWERASGELRAISEVPGPSGAEIVAVNPGAASAASSNTLPGEPVAFSDLNRFNALSADGSRVFFTAERKLGDGPAGAAEVGKLAVFARVDGSETIDISQSQTTTPNAGARYQLASRSGDKVLFTANYGLTEAPDAGWPTSCDLETGAGCDLYEYDFSRPEGQRLVNLTQISGVENAGGAGVVGAVAASDDATKVYFLARGRLVPGTGRSEAQNLARGTYSLYLRSDERIQFVAAVEERDVERLLINDNARLAGNWRAQTTPSGGHLVFPARANVTGEDASEAEQAYLFNAQTGQTVCVSCLRGGGEPVIDPNESVLEPFGSKNRPRKAITDDGRSVFFIKRDILAPGAVEGRPNLYEWHDGQIAYIGSSFQAEAVLGKDWGKGRGLQFIGVSADGKDVYFTSRDRLTWQDSDDLLDVYNARLGGGFPEPPSAPEPCEGESCQGQVAPAPPVRELGSLTFSGDGNLPPSADRERALIRISKLRASTGAVARVRVRVPDSGRIAVRGPAIRRAGKRASKAGVYSIGLALNGKARKLFRKRRTLRVRARVSFRASDGSSAARVIRLSFKRPKARRVGVGRGGR